MLPRLPPVLVALCLIVPSLRAADDDDEKYLDQVRFVYLTDAAYQHIAKALDFAEKAAKAHGRNECCFVATLNENDVQRLLEQVRVDSANHVSEPKSAEDPTEHCVRVCDMESRSLTTSAELTWDAATRCMVPRTRTETLEHGARVFVDTCSDQLDQPIEIRIRGTFTSLEKDPVPTVPAHILYDVTTYIQHLQPTGDFPPTSSGSRKHEMATTNFYIQQPTVERSTVFEKCSIPLGETAVLAGWTRSRKIPAKVPPPMLHNIPYMKHLFDNATSDTEVEHVLILVTPKVLPQTGFVNPNG
jgi:hypothetical protein